VNLIRDPWIPVRHRSGAAARIAPWQITEELGSDPITAFASARPDFDGTLAQLLVGLLQATLAPDNNRQWRQRLKTPLSPNELRTAFEPLVEAFELLGDGPRFLQDLTLREEESKTQGIEKLLIDAGLHRGMDHFRKGGQVNGLCLPCAAAALATLQINAPVGGRGHRASPRGGGPLTTLVRRTTDLWSTLWANVLNADALVPVQPEKDRPEDRFPWLGTTRISDKPEKVTTAADVHPFQIYWPMPRRIRLHSDATEPGPVACDLCGESTETVIRSYWTRHHGVNYTGAWVHPFTPQRESKDGNPLPLQMDSTGLSYRHWLGLVQNDPDRQRHPAPVVEALRARARGADRSQWRLWAFGYDMDNMKARGWYEGMMELLVPEPDLRADFEGVCLCLVRAARWADRATQAGCHQAIRNRQKSGSAAKLTSVEARFWQATEADFYRFVGDAYLALASSTADTSIDALKRRWHRILLRQAHEIFEDWSASGLFDAVDPARVARAWNRLQNNLWSQGMKEALDLDELKTPQPAAATASS